MRKNGLFVLKTILLYWQNIALTYRQFEFTIFMF